MSSKSTSNTGSSLNADEREANWLLLDKRPIQAEIIAYDADTLAEIRRATDAELKLISRRSVSGNSINKETQAFLDSATVVRALAHMAEERFEQGSLDAAAKAVIDAIRWERTADGLYLSGGVSLPRTDPTRLWYLLTEIYVAMGETELADKTAQKASTTIGELTERPLSEVLNQVGRPRNSEPADAAGDGDAPLRPVDRIKAWIVSNRRPRTYIAVAVVILGLVLFTAIRAQIAAKSMIDSSSEGVDYLNIAFDRDANSPPIDSLLLAGEQFARLRAQLEGWSWIITLSSVFPPAHDQFVAMDRMADLGANLVAAPLANSGRGRLAQRGSVGSICAAADHLESFNGNLFDQLEKSRREMLETVYIVTQGTCGLAG